MFLRKEIRPAAAPGVKNMRLLQMWPHISKSSQRVGPWPSSMPLTIVGPADLQIHNAINFNFRSSFDGWPFRAPGETSIGTNAVSGNLLVSSGAMLRQVCLSGIELGRTGQFHVQPDLDAGTLVAVLEDWNPEDLEPIHVVYAGHEHLAARIRAFVDFLVERM